MNSILADRLESPPFMLRAQPPQPSAPPGKMPVEPRVARQQRVLVVDDNEDAALAVSALLRLDGHETVVAHDGLAALEAAGQFQPQVILLDLGLPKLRGEEVARRVREGLGERVLLVAMTGWSTEEDRRATREAGFDHHLIKPVAIEEIQALLRAL